MRVHPELAEGSQKLFLCNPGILRFAQNDGWASATLAESNVPHWRDRDNANALNVAWRHKAAATASPDGKHFLFNSLKDYLWRTKQRNKLICYWLVRLTGRPSRFTFRGHSYRYFWHRYNATWRNERAIEIPIARSYLAGVSPDKVLEIGNVLSHYGPVAHEVVDKYEQTQGVRNEDVCDFRSNKKYELILSISTLEHVGWDEEPRDETKVLRAFDNLQSLLAPGGRLAVTIPVGYNSPLDRMIAEGRISFTERTYLKRNPRRNEWHEVTAAEVRHPQYDRQANCAHELLVGVIENR